MNVLTTRTFDYTDANREAKQLVLTVFEPDRDGELWRVGFVCSPPLQRRMMVGYGEDILQAFTYMLGIVSAYIQGTDYCRVLNWQRMWDYGLPDVAPRPPSWVPPEIPPPEKNPGDLEVFSTRTLGYLDEGGVETEGLLTVFKPKQAEDGRWRCGFTFGPPESSSLHYGVGDDFIEAFLDAVAMARVIYETKVPKGWTSDTRSSCEYLPYKVGRSFYMDDSTKK